MGLELGGAKGILDGSMKEAAAAALAGSTAQEITASINITNMIGQFAASLSGNTSGTLTVISSGTLYLAGGNNVTLSQSGQSISIIAGGDTANAMHTSERANYFATSGNTFANSTHAHGNPALYLTNLTGTTGSNSGGLSISLSAAAPGAGGGINASMGGNTAGVATIISSGTMYLMGGNSITLSQNGQSISISGPTLAQSVESQSMGMSNIGNTSGATGIASGGQVRFIFAGGNNITLSQSINGASGTITISGPNAPTQTVESQSLGMSNIGNTSGTTGIASGGQMRFVFAGGNNITLSQSLNGASGTITISAGAGGAAGSNTIGMSNVGNTSGTTGVIQTSAMQFVFAGGNNITLSQSINGASGTITISGANVGGAQTGISGIAGSAASTVTQGTVQFANANGISFGLNGSTMTASHNALTTGMASNQGSDFIYSSAGKNLTNISATLASNSISLSVGNYITTGMVSDAGSRWIYASAATNMTNISATLGSAGISLSVGNYITTAMLSNMTSNYMSTSERGNYFYTSNNTFANQTHSHGNPTLNLTNLTGTTASGSAGFTLSLSAAAAGGVASQSITLYGNTAGQSTLSMTDNRFYLSGGNNVTLSINGSSIRIDGAAAGGNLTMRAGTNTISNGSFVFSDSNNVIFGLNGSTITANVNAVGLNIGGTNVDWTVNSSGISFNGNRYAGTGSTFAGANISMSMTHNTAGLNISASVAAPGAAAENNWHHLQGNTSNASTASGSTIMLSAGNNITLAASAGSIIKIEAAGGGAGSNTFGISNIGNTSGTSGVVQSSAMQFVLAGGNNVTLSQSINGASATVTISAGAAGGGTTLSRYNPWQLCNTSTVALANRSMGWIPMPVFNPLQASAFSFILHNTLTTSTNDSTRGVALTAKFGIFTNNAGTLSCYTSAEYQTSFSYSSNGTTTRAYSGYKMITMPWNVTLNPGEYWLGTWLSSSTQNVAGWAFRPLYVAPFERTIDGLYGNDTNQADQIIKGWGFQWNTTTDFVTTMAISNISQNNFRSPWVGFYNI